MKPAEIKSLLAQIKALTERVAQLEEHCPHHRDAVATQAIRAAETRRGLEQARRDEAARKHVLDEHKRDPVVSIYAPAEARTGLVNSRASNALRDQEIGLRPYMRESELKDIEREHPDELRAVFAEGVVVQRIDPLDNWELVAQTIGARFERIKGLQPQRSRVLDVVEALLG